MIFKFINKCQTEILRCAPPSYVCNFYISRTSKFSSIGDSLHYVLVCKINIYVLKMTFLSRLTLEILFLCKIFWYNMFCSKFVTNLVPIPWTIQWALSISTTIYLNYLELLPWSLEYFCQIHLNFLSLTRTSLSQTSLNPKQKFRRVATIFSLSRTFYLHAL